MKFPVFLILAVAVITANAWIDGGKNDHNKNSREILSGNCHEDISWEYDTMENTLKVNCDGCDGVLNLVHLNDECLYVFDHAAHIDIGEGFTIIEDGILSLYSLESVKLPSSLREIQDYAFSHSASLTSITLPENLEVVGENAFEGCVSLESIIIPPSVKTLGSYAFSGCIKFDVS